MKHQNKHIDSCSCSYSCCCCCCFCYCCHRLWKNGSRYHVINTIRIHICIHIYTAFFTLNECSPHRSSQVASSDGYGDGGIMLVGTSSLLLVLIMLCLPWGCLLLS